jgi:hypothetical protein
VISTACASPGVPPGGPVDTEAPKVLRITPDSGKTGVTPHEVVFKFDEVVNERPAAVQSLGALFLISPRDGDPRVGWHRSEVSVRPRKGWKANTAYTITMLPGISDLRGNIRNSGTVTMFATGATFPTSRIRGTLFNWADARVLPKALVEARPVTDTATVYVASTDSTGSYTLPNLPPGQYLVRGIGDENNNRGLDPREMWDTASVSLADSASVDLYAFVHDSTGSRLQNVRMDDSVSITLNFDNPLSISQPLTAANVRVRGPDSTDVGIVSAMPPAPDTTATGVKLSRPAPSRSVKVKLARQLVPGATYRVIVTDARNLMGVARTSESRLTVPKPPAPAAAPPVIPPAPAPSPVKR